jgi:hypothetical protein
MLFAEAMDGLEASKEPVVIQKGDGTPLEVPGDLGARAAFIRAGQGIVDSQVKLHGLLDGAAPLPSNTTFAQVIVLPKSPKAYRLIDAEPKVVDALPEPADQTERKESA